MGSSGLPEAEARRPRPKCDGKMKLRERMHIMIAGCREQHELGDVIQVVAILGAESGISVFLSFFLLFFVFTSENMMRAYTEET